MSENIDKTITIKSIEMKTFDNGGSQYKLVATDGTKYKFNTTKKEGGETVAFGQFKNMGIKNGMTVNVWYKPVEKEYQGKKYTDNMVGSFREAPAAQTYAPETKSSNGNDAFGKRLALHGFVNARLINNPISQVIQEIPHLLDLEEKISVALEAPPLPDEPVNPEDLPF